MPVMFAVWSVNTSSLAKLFRGRLQCGRPGFRFPLWQWGFLGGPVIPLTKDWHSGGYPARRHALWSLRWDRMARCQYAVTFIHHDASTSDSLHKLNRTEQVIVFRLRTGHNRLNAHMYNKFKVGESEMCPCNADIMTAEHFTAALSTI